LFWRRSLPPTRCSAKLRKSMRVISVIATAAAMIITALPSNAAVSGAATTPKVPARVSDRYRQGRDTGSGSGLDQHGVRCLPGRLQGCDNESRFHSGRCGRRFACLRWANRLHTDVQHVDETANVQGDVNLTTGKFQATSTSVTGTGALNGISGSLTFLGTQMSGSFTETITGSLCSRVRPW